MLLGDCYGNAVLPLTISVEDFKALTDSDRLAKVPNGHLLQKWYHVDENAVPAVYVLQVCVVAINAGV